MTQTIRFYIFFVFFLLTFFLKAEEYVSMNKKLISEFGKYEGYSEPIYDEWVRASRYLEMSDGVKLAMDIIRPAKNGRAVEEPLPTVWNYYRYNRAREEDGKIISMVDRLTSLQILIRHGYVIVVVDARGTGASYGSGDRGPNTKQEARHTHDITEWIAAQKWCDGNVGMFGHSYSANIQFLAAGKNPPHLKAIFPCMASFDTYRIFYRGGVFYDKGAQGISRSLHYWDIETSAPGVDEDSTGELLREARAEHQNNADPYVFLKMYTYRNTQENDLKFWMENNPVAYLAKANESTVPVYQWAGWFDFLVRDSFLWFANLGNPQKLTVGPWAHGSHDWYDLLSVEQLRWFDYWLKGIDNGIMDEPKIQYVIIEKPDVFTWHTSNSWPLPESKQIPYYFKAGPSNSIQSVNDGILSKEKPKIDKGYDSYLVDYSASSEEEDMSANDAKGLTYTSPPLESEVTVVGHPVVTLYIESSAEDGDFYVYLEEVDTDGVSHHLTDGILRASHRTSSDPPFNNLGLPHHRHLEEDVKSLPKGETVALVFDLLPISKVFKQGHRIRVTITCADKSYTEENIIMPPPTVKLYRNRQYHSHITLPIVK
jgi:hypothetical protein